MKRFQILFVMVLSVLISACGTSGGNQSNDGSQSFWGAKGDANWKTGFDTCWQTMHHTKGKKCGVEEVVMQEPPVVVYYDHDYDGVYDRNDMCQYTPNGVQVDAYGCALDLDGDGIADYLDSCPETPPGLMIDAYGCANLVVQLGGVSFKFDSATLTAKAKSILDEYIPMLSSSNNFFVIEGHTDNSGPKSYNQTLSESRAKSVMAYLISNGVQASKLSAVGLGEDYPLFSNATRDSRMKNRRVMIIKTR